MYRLHNSRRADEHASRRRSVFSLVVALGQRPSASQTDLVEAVDDLDEDQLQLLQAAEQFDGSGSTGDLDVDLVDGFRRSWGDGPRRPGRLTVGRRRPSSSTSGLPSGLAWEPRFPVSEPGVCMHRRATLSVAVAHPVAHLSGETERAGPCGPALTWCSSWSGWRDLNPRPLDPQ